MRYRDYTFYMQHHYTVNVLRPRYDVRIRSVFVVNGGATMTTTVAITPMKT